MLLIIVLFLCSIAVVSGYVSLFLASRNNVVWCCQTLTRPSQPDPYMHTFISSDMYMHFSQHSKHGYLPILSTQHEREKKPWTTESPVAAFYRNLPANIFLDFVPKFPQYKKTISLIIRSKNEWGDTLLTVSVFTIALRIHKTWNLSQKSTMPKTSVHEGEVWVLEGAAASNSVKS